MAGAGWSVPASGDSRAHATVSRPLLETRALKPRAGLGGQGSSVWPALAFGAGRLFFITVIF